jgi:hypothetical protein
MFRDDLEPVVGWGACAFYQSFVHAIGNGSLVFFGLPFPQINSY